MPARLAIAGFGHFPLKNPESLARSAGGPPGRALCALCLCGKKVQKSELKRDRPVFFPPDRANVARMQMIENASKTATKLSGDDLAVERNIHLYELLDREARQLAKMRARGKKNAQIIDWLRNRGVNASSTELDAYWQHLAEQQAKQKQQWIQERGQRPPANGNIREVALSPDDDENRPAPRNAVTATHKNEEVETSDGCTPQDAPVTTEQIMVKYRQLLMKVLRQGDTGPESLKVVNQMIKNLNTYERIQKQSKKERERTSGVNANSKIEVKPDTNTEVEESAEEGGEVKLEEKSKAPNAGSETGKLKSERSQSIPFHHPPHADHDQDGGDRHAERRHEKGGSHHERATGEGNP